MSVEFVDFVGAAGHFVSFAELEEAAIIEVGVVEGDSWGAVVGGDSTGILVGVWCLPTSEWGPAGGQVHFSVPVDPQKVLGNLGGLGELGSNNRRPGVVVGDHSGTSVGVENGVENIGDELLVGLLVGAPGGGLVDLNPDEDILEFLVQSVDHSVDLIGGGGEVVLAVGQARNENGIVTFQIGTVEGLDDVLDSDFVDHTVGGVDSSEDHLEGHGLRVEATELGGRHRAGGVNSHRGKGARDHA